MSSVVLLPASFAILLAGALLFTNAIECSALIYRGRRPQALSCTVHFPTLERDLGFFMGCFLVAFCSGSERRGRCRSPARSFSCSRTRSTRAGRFGTAAPWNARRS